MFVIALLPTHGFCQGSPVGPTELEAFVSEPGVTVVFEEEIARLRSPDSAIDIHRIDARTSDGKRGLAGVRVNLRTNAWQDSVFLNADELAALAHQLSMMEGSLEALRDRSHPFNTTFQWGDRMIGSQQCWPPSNPGQRRILCPSYRAVNGFETFSVYVFGTREIYGLAPEQLGEMRSAIRSAVQSLQGDGQDAEPAFESPVSVESVHHTKPVEVDFDAPHSPASASVPTVGPSNNLKPADSGRNDRSMVVPLLLGLAVAAIATLAFRVRRGGCEARMT